MDEHWYVDENFRILKGEDASKALQEISDADYLSQSQGIVRVTRARWQIAQTFERKGWMGLWIQTADDRNLQHMADFDNYEELHDRRFQNAIELGCGPFTNLRLIGQICQVKECTLLDPLVRDYLKHPNCSYDAKWLRCGENGLSKKLSVLKPLRAVRRVIRRLFPGTLQRRIRVRELVAGPIEEMPAGERYDLIVIINVIEHCYDINRVFENIVKIAAPNAILVFHDKYL